jgi:hypothetical protein
MTLGTLRASCGLQEPAPGAPAGAAPDPRLAAAKAPGQLCPRVPICRQREAAREAPPAGCAAAPRWQPPAANLRRERYVTFHRGHCRRQEEQQQAIQGHRRPPAPRPSPSRDGGAGRERGPGEPLRSQRVASPYPFALSPGPDSPERGVGVGGSVRAWGGAGARGCGCACVCVCLWERWVCACVCEREGEGERAWESARERVRPGVTLRATAEPTRGRSRPD